MKRYVILAIIKMLGTVILLTTIAVIIVVVIGYLNKWNTSIAYSNAFFIAGSLMIVAGAFSRLGAGQEWSIFQLLSANSLRNMNSGERANYIVDASSSASLVILGVLSGMLLILISVVMMYR